MGIRVNKAMTKLNIGKETVVEYLKSKPELEPTKELNPNSKLTDAQFEALAKEFAPDMLIREKARTHSLSTLRSRTGRTSTTSCLVRFVTCQ